MPIASPAAGATRSMSWAGAAFITCAIITFAIITCAIGLLVTASPADAAKRVALVIGNNAYENVPKL
jgi:hypothetical protein